MARIVNIYPSLNEVDKQYKEYLANESDFRKTAQNLFSLVNKRIKRLQATNGIVSPALTMLNRQRNGNLHFSARRDYEDLKKEYAQAYAFYKLETSTVASSRTFTNKLEKRIGERIHDVDYVSEIFDTMHAIADRIPNEIFKGMIGTNELLQQVIENAVDSESEMYYKTESERDAYISKQVQKVVEQIYKESKEASESINKSLESAFNKLW